MLRKLPPHTPFRHVLAKHSSRFGVETGGPQGTPQRAPQGTTTSTFPTTTGTPTHHKQHHNGHPTDHKGGRQQTSTANEHHNEHPHRPQPRPAATTTRPPTHHKQHHNGHPTDHNQDPQPPQRGHPPTTTSCLSFVLCKCVHAFALLFDVFVKLGVNFGIYATSRAMQQFKVWLATIRTRTCSSVDQGEARRVGWG